MSIHNGVLQPEQGHGSRNRFVLCFFGVGVSVPVILVMIGHLVGPWNGEGILGTIWWYSLWIIWPTWVFMIDAEHTSQIIFMLLFAAPVNGLWYGTVGLLVWYLRRRWKRPDSERGGRSAQALSH
jgi:hypothetical protein